MGLRRAHLLGDAGNRNEEVLQDQERSMEPDWPPEERGKKGPAIITAASAADRGPRFKDQGGVT